MTVGLSHSLRGTTTPFKPLRKGTAFLIKQFKPVVVPIVIDGFRRSFDKRGLRIKKKNVIQKMKIKNLLELITKTILRMKLLIKLRFQLSNIHRFQRFDINFLLF